MHQSGPVGILDSVHFLLAMEPSLNACLMKDRPSALPDTSSRKGKDLSSSNRSSRWTPPPPGWTKINVDGSFLQETGAAGLGVIARDSSGGVLFTAWRTIHRCADAAEAEAIACAEGLALAVRYSPGSIILESDCARLVKTLQEKEDRSEIGFIVADAKKQAQLLADWRVAQVKREGNSVAHELAQLARRVNVNTEVPLGAAPACVLPLIASDCNHLA
jgi:ribonuclease HI